MSLKINLSIALAASLLVACSEEPAGQNAPTPEYKPLSSEQKNKVSLVGESLMDVQLIFPEFSSQRPDRLTGKPQLKAVEELVQRDCVVERDLEGRGPEARVRSLKAAGGEACPIRFDFLAESMDLDTLVEGELNQKGLLHWNFENKLPTSLAALDVSQVQLQGTSEYRRLRQPEYLSKVLNQTANGTFTLQSLGVVELKLVSTQSLYESRGRLIQSHVTQTFLKLPDGTKVSLFSSEKFENGKLIVQSASLNTEKLEAEDFKRFVSLQEPFRIPIR